MLTLYLLIERIMSKIHNAIQCKLKINRGHNNCFIFGQTNMQRNVVQIGRSRFIDLHLSSVKQMQLWHPETFLGIIAINGYVVASLI